MLYAGMLGYGGTCLERKEVLQSLDIEVIPFDVQPATVAAHRLVRSAAERVQLGPLIAQLNHGILAFARTVAFDGVWVDKGTWLHPETLAELRRLSAAKLLVHYTPDAQFLTQRSRLFFGCIPLYDLCVTTKPFELEHYGRAGARRTVMVLQGHSRFFSPDMAHGPQADRYRSDTIFVGHRQPHYVRSLRALAASDVELAIHGPRWPRYARRHRWAQRVVRSDGVHGHDYATALAAARIGIGLLGKHIPETTTTRSFEIPASGALLLAERTGDHQALFEEDAEAVFWSSPEELCDKARHYLANEPARARIAAAGRARCQRSRYDTPAQMHRILQALDLPAPAPASAG